MYYTYNSLFPVSSFQDSLLIIMYLYFLFTISQTYRQEFNLFQNKILYKVRLHIIL